VKYKEYSINLIPSPMGQGDDHIFFIQARNLAGPPRFPKRWCAAQIWADNLILDGCSFAFAFYRRILASYQAIG